MLPKSEALMYGVPMPEPLNPRRHFPQSWFGLVFKTVARVAFVVFLLALMFFSPVLINAARHAHLRWTLRDKVLAKELLVECQQLMISTPLEPGAEWRFLPASSCPPLVQKLAPSWVGVSKAQVHLEMGGGFEHFGVDCFSQGLAGEGDQKVIDGVWLVAD